MASLRDYIDNCILARNYNGTGGIKSRISDRLKVFIEAREKNTLSPSNYSGIDKLIAERVVALCKPVGSNVEEVTTVVKAETPKAKKKAFSDSRDDVTSSDGYVAWAGNEAYICPWPKVYISKDSSGDTAGPNTPTSYRNYENFCTKVPFNSSAETLAHDKQLMYNSMTVIDAVKSSKTIILGIKDDKDAFIPGSGTSTELKKINLSSHISATYWAFGKILLLGDILAVQILRMPDERTKNWFEAPGSVEPGFTVDYDLLVISLSSGMTIKYTSAGGAIQSKTSIVRGYTDIIVHQGKLYSIRSLGSPDVVEFKGKLMGQDPNGNGLIVTGVLKHKFDSYKYEIVEVVTKLTDGVLTSSIKKVADVKPPPPPDGAKFGITGSIIVYTGAKLAASDLNPYSFYVQQYYEQVLQMPYNYAEKFNDVAYWETGLGKKLRLEPDFYEKVLDGTANAVYNNSSLIVAISGIKYGGVNKIAGQLYLEIPTNRSNDGNYTVYTSGANADIIYELVGESQPCFDPTTSDWKRWYNTGYAAAFDIYVVWHMVSKELGTGSAKSSTVCSKLNLGVQTGKHPIVVKIEEKIKNKETVSGMMRSIINTWPQNTKNLKWSYTIPITVPGTVPFPAEKRFTYFGGTRGSMSREISGYVGNMITFLVTFNGEKMPVNGARTSSTARPVLIIAGIGMYIEAWGAKGWGDQMTQSPIVAECYAYETVSNVVVDKFAKVNDTANFPKVYMQAQIEVLGIIGNFMTGWDETDPSVELMHGMYPIPQNGIHINSKGEQIEQTIKCWANMAIRTDNLRQIYYLLFCYIVEYNTVTKKYEYNNYYLQTKAYEVKTKKVAATEMAPATFEMDFNAAIAVTGWWSTKAPAKPTDPIPWWGPCSLNLHIKL